MASTNSDTAPIGSSANGSSTNPNPQDAVSSQWKTPSAAYQQMYGVCGVPDDVTPTAEEELVLRFYDTIRAYERQAARLQDDAARAKLASRDAAFQAASVSRNPRKRRERTRITTTTTTTEDSDDPHSADEEDDEDDDAASEDAEARHARREAKLEELRDQVAQAHQLAQERTRVDEPPPTTWQTATVDDAVDVGSQPVLKKKKRIESDPSEPTSSLIANITVAQTPPHDFSKTLALVPGRTLWPTTISTTEPAAWTPPAGCTQPNEGAFAVHLDNFDILQAQNGSGNNTVAVKFTAPSDSKRFSINIAAPDHEEFHSVLFHFNPRQHERGGQLIVNDKQEGIWGQAIAIPLSQVPLVFGQTACTLLIQVNGEGFDIFLEGQHCARLEHRKEIATDTDHLVLQFPSTDDYGSPENWLVHKVWWGNQPILAKGDLANVAGVHTYNALHPRKLFVSRLAKIFSEAEVDLRRAELERAFRQYGGVHGVSVIVPTNATFAFVETESERAADLALQEMTAQYRVSRARRSRHEALQEERAAAEASARGETKEHTVWD